MKIVIFYVRAGGGHKSAADAISAYYHESHPDVNVVSYDALASSSVFMQNVFTKGYVFLTEKYPWIWRVLCWLWSFSWIARLQFWLLRHTSNVYQNIEHIISIEKPDIIISTYFGIPLYITEIAQKLGCTIPVVVPVLDVFSPEPVWFLEKHSSYVVFSQQAKQKALDFSIDTKNITQSNPFFNKKFETLMTQDEKTDFCTREGISIQRPLVLVLGGGESMPKGYQIFRKLLKSDETFDIIMVCGRNEELKKQCEDYVSFHTSPNHNVHIYGFSSYIYEFMNIASVVIIKAGPATIFEVLSLHKPIIISSLIKPQEQGNLDYVVSHNYGYFGKNPTEIVTLLHHILDKKQSLNDYSNTRFSSGISDFCESVVNN